MNVLTIKRNVEGLPVALRLQNGSWLDDSVAFFAVKVGELTDGSVELKWGDSNTQTFPLDTHADDNGVNGAVAYAELVRLTTHTEHPHTDISPAKSLGERINGALLSIANIFMRLEKLEAKNLPPIIFDKWVVQGQELRLNRGGSTGDDCIIGITHGFGGLCPSRIEGQPESSQERILTIEVNGSTHLLHIFSRGDTGRIADAIASNSQVPTLGTSRPESGGESG